MVFSRLVALALLASLVLAAAASAQPADDPVVVIEVEGPLDQRSLDYVTTALAAESVHVFVLKVDSPGVSSGDLAVVTAAIETATAPVVSWIGPVGAEAFGGSAYIVNHADLRSAAPGAHVGHLSPVVQREPGAVYPWRGVDPSAWSGDGRGSIVEVVDDTEGIQGFVDVVEPALGGLIISLDGMIVDRGDQSWELSTARTETINDREVVVSSRNVVFVKAGLIDRFLHLGSRPETAFLFLVIGLAFAAFEFYAAGRGLMAGVASMSLLIGGYGLATLPIWWPAVAVMFVGLGVLVWGFAQNRVDWRAVVGTLLLVASGASFTTTRPAYPPAIWMVLLAVGASVVFIWYSLTTVVRGRFATPTVGREEMLGQRCLAVSDLDPEGVVLLDGARWTATADRGVVIRAGAAAEIVGITGLVLEVDPVVATGREGI